MNLQFPKRLLAGFLLAGNFTAGILTGGLLSAGFCPAGFCPAGKWPDTYVRETLVYPHVNGGWQFFSIYPQASKSATAL